MCVCRNSSGSYVWWEKCVCVCVCTFSTLFSNIDPHWWCPAALINGKKFSQQNSATPSNVMQKDNDVDDDDNGADGVYQAI